MKHIVSIFICLIFALCASASDVKIDKENCTITKDGKTYKLYGKVKIVGGTLVTEWLYRTLSPDECAIKDVIMDAEKLFRVIRYGIVSDFRSYSHDITYSIEYGNNKDLPDGLEEKLDLMSTYETSDGKKHYLSNRVIQFSFALYTYDNWIKYFSKISTKFILKYF